MSVSPHSYNFKHTCQQAEELFVLISKCSNDAEKRKLCSLLIQLMQSLTAFDTNFDPLIASIEDLSKCKDIECRTVWVQILNELSRFNAEYKRSYKNDLLSHIFRKDFIDKKIKKATIDHLTEKCSAVTDLSKEMKVKIVTFLIFDQLLLSDDPDIVFSLKNSLMAINETLLPHFLFDFAIEVSCLAGFKCLKDIIYLRAKVNEGNTSVRSKAVESLFHIFDLGKIYSDKAPIKKKAHMTMVLILLCYYSNFNSKVSLDYFEYFAKKNFLFTSRVLIDLLNAGKRALYLKQSLSKPHENQIGQTFASLSSFLLNYDEEAIRKSTSIVNDFFLKRAEDRTLLLEDDKYLITGIFSFINQMLFIPNLIESNQYISSFANSSIHLTELLENLLQLKHLNDVSKPILSCLNKLIKRFGSEMVNEWDIILKILRIYRNQHSDNVHISSEDIIHSILCLELNGRFKGDRDRLVSLINSLTDYSFPLILMTKMSNELQNESDFCNQFEAVFIKYLGITTEHNAVYSYLLNFIYHKYQSCYLKEDQSEVLIIEKILNENFIVIIEAFSANQAILQKFSLILSEILALTNHLAFFKEMFAALLGELQNDQSTIDFRDNCLMRIIKKLNASDYQQEKMEIVLGIIFLLSNSSSYNRDTHETEKKTILCLLSLLMKFKYNQHCEVIINDDDNAPYCQGILVTNYYNDDIHDVDSYYRPFVVFKHNLLFSFFVAYLCKDIASLRISKAIMAYLSDELFKVLFYKGIPTDKLIRFIIFMKQDKMDKTNHFDAIIQVLVNCAYHLDYPQVNTRVSFTAELRIEDKMLKENIIEFTKKKLEYYLPIVISGDLKKEKASKRASTTTRDSKLLLIDSLCIEGGIAPLKALADLKSYLYLTEIYLISLINQSKEVAPMDQKLSYYTNDLLNILTSFALEVKERKYSQCFPIVSFFFMTKDFFLKYNNEDAINRIIALITIIIWPKYSDDFITSFRKHFGDQAIPCEFNAKSFSKKNRKASSTPHEGNGLLREWIWFFGLSTLLYYFSVSPSREIIKDIYMQVLIKNKKKEEMSIEMLNWYLSGVNNKRNSMPKSIHSNKNEIEQYRGNKKSFLLSNLDLITIELKSEAECDVYMRSPVSSMHHRIDRNKPIAGEDKEIQLNVVEKKIKEIIDSYNPSRCPTELWDQIVSIINAKELSPNEITNVAKLSQYTTLLDATPVNETYYCDVMFLHSSTSEYPSISKDFKCSPSPSDLLILQSLGTVSLTSVDSSTFFIQTAYQDIISDLTFKTPLLNRDNCLDFELNQSIDVMEKSHLMSNANIQVIFLNDYQKDVDAVFNSVEAALVYIMIYSFSSAYFSMRIMFNTSVHFNQLIDKIRKTIQMAIPLEITIIKDEELSCFKRYLISVVVLIETVIKYSIGKIAYGNKQLLNEVVYEASIEQRYSLFEKLHKVAFLN